MKCTICGHEKLCDECWRKRSQLIADLEADRDRYNELLYAVRATAPMVDKLTPEQAHEQALKTLRNERARAAPTDDRSSVAITLPKGMTTEAARKVIAEALADIARTGVIPTHRPVVDVPGPARKCGTCRWGDGACCADCTPPDYPKWQPPAGAELVEQHRRQFEAEVNPARRATLALALLQATRPCDPSTRTGEPCSAHDAIKAALALTRPTDDRSSVNPDKAGWQFDATPAPDNDPTPQPARVTSKDAIIIADAHRTLVELATDDEPFALLAIPTNVLAELLRRTGYRVEPPRTCPTCRSYFKPRFDCPTCGGTGVEPPTPPTDPTGHWRCLSHGYEGTLPRTCPACGFPRPPLRKEPQR